MAEKRFQVLGAFTGSSDEGPWARLAGRREDGRSVCVTVLGALPYFYVRLEHGLLLEDGAPNLELLEELKVDLNRRLNTCVRDKPSKRWRPGGHLLVFSVEVVERFDFYGYSSRKHRYARLTFTSLGAHRAARWAFNSLAGTSGPKARKPPLSFRTVRRIFPGREEDLERAFRGDRGAVRKGLSLVLAEANIEFHDQVMDDIGIRPGCWCAPGPGLSATGDLARVDVVLEAHDLMGVAELREQLLPVEVPRAAPVRVLAWDLEVWCEPLGDGAMRFFEGDDAGARLLCVSAVTFDYGVPGSTRSVVFCLTEGDERGEEEATATDGSRVMLRWFRSERELMEGFFLHIRDIDPDVLTGWNTLSFDWPWLCKRAAALKVDTVAMARWDGVLFDESKDARQVVVVPGREVHDMMLWTKKNRQLREYTLQSVATEYGLDGKDDVSYSQISELFGTHEGRVKLAVYCELDSRLVAQLMQLPQLDPLGKTLAIAAITGVQPEHVLHRGSMHTLRLAMLRASHASDFVLSCPSRGDAADAPLTGDEEDDARFQVRAAGRPCPPVLTPGLRGARCSTPSPASTATPW